MNRYELTVLYHPDLEMNIAPATAKVETLLKNNGGKIVSSENEGKKHLCYDINGQKYAIYYFYLVELPAEAPAKISSSLNITEECLRHLLVREDPRKAKYAALRAAAKGKDEDESSSADAEDENSTDKADDDTENN